MAGNNKVLSELKAILFELTYSLDQYRRKEVIHRLCGNLEQLISADHVSCYMYNKWNIGNQITEFDDKAGQPSNISPQQLFDDYFESEGLIHPLPNNSTDGTITYLFKIYCNDFSYGLFLITLSKSYQVDYQLFKAIRDNLEQFIQILFNNRNRQFLRRRSQHLFHLSTELHSVHQTNIVLDSMYKTIQKLYPFFKFRLLMSKEYDCQHVPIKLIEYSGDMESSPGTLAFIQNEVQVQARVSRNEMRVYSPLAGKQAVYGVVEIIIPQIVDRKELELDVIGQFSNMVGRAIERTTLFQSSNQQVSDLQIINTASHELNKNLERSDIIGIVKKYVIEASQAEEVGVVIFEEEIQETDRPSFEILEGSTPFFLSEGGQRLITYLIDELESSANPILSGNFHTTYPYTPYHSLMVIPMWSTDTIFGLIVIAHETPYHFTFDKFKFVQSFIQHASLAFKNSVLKEQLRKLATTDYLTKLYSRNYLDKRIGKCMEKDETGNFVLFDVDDFKLINDTYGHYIGDKVLIQVANIIHKEIKSTGIAARWGGEEFAIYFPNTSIYNTMETVDNIRRRVATETEPGVTLSCGVSRWATYSENDSIEKLFIRADEALYEAKLAGKNRITLNESTSNNSL